MTRYCDNLHQVHSKSKDRKAKQFNLLGAIKPKDLNRIAKLSQKKKIVGKATKAMHEVLKKGRVHNLSIKCQYDLFDKMVICLFYYTGVKYGVLVTMA